MNDPRQAKTLGEACQNPDGTYNAFKLLSWLSAVVGGGQGMSESEVRSMAEDILKRKADERARARNT